MAQPVAMPLPLCRETAASLARLPLQFLGIFLTQNCGGCFHCSLATANVDAAIAIGCMATVVVIATTTTATASRHLSHN